jgi:hypothetical protein
MIPRVAAIDTQLADVDGRLSSLEDLQRSLTSERRKLLSQQFVEVTNVTLADVELSTGEDRPYFTTFGEFGKWLKKNNIQRRYAEWNTLLYYTSDAMAGRMGESLAELEDVPA